VPGCGVLDRPIHHSAKNATTRPKKSVNFDHEIMEIGLICSNLIEKKLPAILGRTLSGIFRFTKLFSGGS
jgi:hypothetical protein